MLFDVIRTATFIDDILGYVNQGLNFVAGQSAVMQVVIYAAVVIFVLVGFFVFISKFIKVFLVLGVLGGVVYYLWFQTDVLNSIKDMLGLSAYIQNIFVLF